MAPIDPQQILKAFDPVCSENGGIINTKEVPGLSKLLKKYSKKLVSKCTYCNILLATNEKVLEEFLNYDGWETINGWLKDAIEKKNNEFLLVLIQVLNKCPITVDRLKENDTPKLLKNVVKADNEELSRNAKKLRAKWKEFVNDSIDKPIIKEKRKLKDSSNSNRENNQLNNTSNTNKKLKTDKDENVNLDNNNLQECSKRESTGKTEILNNSEQNDSDNKIIKSTKCKLGKSRSIGVLEKTGMGYTKPISTNGSPLGNQNADKKSSPNSHSNVGSSFITKNTPMLLNHTASTPSMPLNKLSKNDKNGIQIIDPQPLPVSEFTNITTSHPNKHIIKESASFMDAISSVPTNKIKKKKKISTTVDKAFSIKEDNKIEVDNFLSDLNDSNHLTSTDDRRLSESTHENLNKVTETEFLVFSKESPYDPNRQPKKSILQYVAKGRKRNIFWPEDDKLEKVKFFELDDKERCNVYKQNNFNEHRKEEMEKERNQMNSIRGQLKYLNNNPGVCFFPWRLIKIDGLNEGENCYPTGRESEEKIKQAERLKNVLEFIDLPGKPEFPKEPDANSNDLLEDNQTREILLGDENCATSDFSNNQFTVADSSNNVNLYSIAAGQTSNDSADNLYNYQQMANANHLMNNPQFLNSVNNVNHLLNNQNMYNQQQVYTNIYLNSSNGHQMPITTDQNHWSTANWDYPQNNHHNKNQNKNQSNKGNKKLICKFWSKNGNCRNGTNCAFLHSK